MKISKLKKSASVLFVAAMTGVVLFSAGSASGVVSPSFTPTDNAGVSPTFSGLSVNGTSTFDGSIDVKNGDLDVSGSLDVSRDLNVLGSIFKKNGNDAYEPVVIAEGGLKLKKSSYEFLTLDEDSIETNFRNLSINANGNPLTLGSSSSNVTVRGELKVDGVLDADTAEFSTMTTTGLTVEGNPGGGKAKADAFIIDYAGNFTGMSDYPYDVYMANDSSNINVNDDNFVIKSYNAIKLQSDGGSLRLQYDGDVVASDDVYADSFGVVKNYGSGWQSFTTGNSWTTGLKYTYSCPYGYIAIACTYNDRYTDQNNVNVQDLYNTGSSCKITFDAKDDIWGKDPQLKIHASCWKTTE